MYFVDSFLAISESANRKEARSLCSRVARLKDPPCVVCFEAASNEIELENGQKRGACLKHTMRDSILARQFESLTFQHQYNGATNSEMKYILS